MFISFSKTLAKFGGFRLGVGVRMNKKNAVWISFIAIFIVLFKLTWYMLLFSGWMIYAVFYGLYWCIKKMFPSKKQNNSKNVNSKSQISKQKEDIKNDDHQTESTQDTEKNSKNNLNKEPPRNKSKIARWVVGSIFALFAVVNGFHFSSLLLLAAAFLMFPLDFVETFLNKNKIKPVLAIILSVSLFFVACVIAPDNSNPSGNDINQSIIDNTGTSTTNSGTTIWESVNTTHTTASLVQPGVTTEPTQTADTVTTAEIVTTTNNTTSAHEVITTAGNTTVDHKETTQITQTTQTTRATTATTEKTEVKVWVSSTGSKYHSKSNCSGMKSPSQISLETAIRRGLTPCSKCY